MEKILRRIPYGTMNWALIVRECHFVDNTAYIRRLENVRTPVFLRPKRFGKTMVCSMLAHYYDIALKDRFDELFGMTDIGREPTAERNAYADSTWARPCSCARICLVSSVSRSVRSRRMWTTSLPNTASCAYERERARKGARVRRAR